MDYEKKYNEALERARKIHDEIVNNEVIGFPGQITDIFPELAESEDEKAMKLIASVFSEAGNRYIQKSERDIVLAYLEKQKEIPMPNSTKLIEMWHDEEAMLKEKNVTINVHTQGSQFNTECDRMQIKRVLTNILGNAISYAYDNTQIDVTIRQYENGISFEAKNQSAYINPETMNNLFKKYVSHAAKFNKVGVGLGLYLSKQIIDAHDGEIYARSFEDNHNIFGFILPLVNKTESDSVVA